MTDNYKQYSIVQFIFILFTGLTVLDFALANDDQDFGLFKLLWEDNNSVWWSYIAVWGYCFIIVAIFQLLKALDHD